jgi:hypothetical protein
MNESEEERDRPAEKKTLARSLGEFFGHIAKGVKTDPAKKVVRKEVEEEERPGMTLRRTTIEEIELHSNKKSKKSDQRDDSP